MDFRDYYADLGLTSTATHEEIKKAFRALARKHHPDANQGNPGAEEAFKKISEAYDILGDQEKRKKYDQIHSQYQNYKSHAGSRGGSWDDFSKSGSYKFNNDDFGDAFEGTTMSDLLSQLFGSRTSTKSKRSRTSTQRQPPPQLRIFTVTLSLEEAFHGVTKRLILGDTKLDVAFKPGITEGQQLKTPAGNLEIHISEHPHIIREGNDLRVQTSVPFTTLLLGGQASVEALGGSVSMKIPAHTSNGKTFRVRGRGMPIYGEAGKHGDLYVTVHASFPKELTSEQRQIVESLRDLGL